jgi:hypothetical protein
MMEVDQPKSRPPTKSVGPESSLPPGHPTRNSNKVPAQLLVSKPERVASSTSPRNATQSVPHEDQAPEDVSLLPSVVQQKRVVQKKLPTPKPCLSLADYCWRNVRPSVLEERHASQSMSPSLPDHLELSRATPAGINSLQQNETNYFPLTQQSTQPSLKNEASTPGDAVDEGRHALPNSSRSKPFPSHHHHQQQQQQQPAHKTNIVDVKAARVTLALKVSSESRATDTSMYFPPISPPIVMAMESSRSPGLKSLPSPPGLPLQETTVSQDTRNTALPKSSSRTSPESTPVTSTSSPKGESKPSVATPSTAVPSFAGHSAKPSGTEDRMFKQTALPAPDSLGVPLPYL